MWTGSSRSHRGQIVQSSVADSGNAVSLLRFAHPPRPPRDDDLLPLERLPLERDPLDLELLPDDRTVPELLLELPLDRVARDGVDLDGADLVVVALERVVGDDEERTPLLRLVPLLDRTADRVVVLVGVVDRALVVVLLCGDVPL